MKEILNEWREFLNEKNQPPKNIIPKGFVEYETKEGDTIQSLIDEKDLSYGTTTPQGRWNYNNIQIEFRIEYGRINPGTDIKQLEIPVGTKVVIRYKIVDNLKEHHEEKEAGVKAVLETFKGKIVSKWHNDGES